MEIVSYFRKSDLALMAAGTVLWFTGAFLAVDDAMDAARQHVTLARPAAAIEAPVEIRVGMDAMASMAASGVLISAGLLRAARYQQDL